MKRNLHINGDLWKIRIRKNLKDDSGNPCHGLCDYDTKTIYIDRATKNSKAFLATVIHEVVHATLFSSHIELDPLIDECVAGNLEKAIVSIFRVSLK